MRDQCPLSRGNTSNLRRQISHRGGPLHTVQAPTGAVRSTRCRLPQGRSAPHGAGSHRCCPIRLRGRHEICSVKSPPGLIRSTPTWNSREAARSLLLTVSVLCRGLLQKVAKHPAPNATRTEQFWDSDLHPSVVPCQHNSLHRGAASPPQPPEKLSSEQRKFKNHSSLHPITMLWRDHGSGEWTSPAPGDRPRLSRLIDKQVKPQMCLPPPSPRLHGHSSSGPVTALLRLVSYWTQRALSEVSMHHDQWAL